MIKIKALVEFQFPERDTESSFHKAIHNEEELSEVIQDLMHETVKVKSGNLLNAVMGEIIDIPEIQFKDKKYSIEVEK
jgi:hypothetical protein